MLTVVHRDVKPENLLVGGGRTACVSSTLGARARWAAASAASAPTAGRARCSTAHRRSCSTRGRRATYDVFSAALVWLRAIVPHFRASEDELFRFRRDLRDHGKGSRASSRMFATALTDDDYGTSSADELLSGGGWERPLAFFTEGQRGASRGASSPPC